jgi:hypothetical protein
MMTLPFVSNLGHPLRLNMHNGFWCYFLFQLSEYYIPLLISIHQWNSLPLSKIIITWQFIPWHHFLGDKNICSQDYNY